MMCNANDIYDAALVSCRSEAWRYLEIAPSGRLGRPLEDEMGEIMVIGSIIGGIGLALAATRFGLSIVVDLIPLKQR